MSIENIKDGKWRFRIRKYGQRYTQNYFCDTKVTDKKTIPKEVLNAHKKFEVDIMHGDVADGENMRFDELCNLVMEEYVKPNLRANTQLRYKKDYNVHLIPAFGSLRISKIKNIHIQKFVNNKAKNLKGSSVGEIINILNSTFNCAVKWTLMKDNPCKNLTLPKIEKNNYNELLSAYEIKLLFEHSRKNHIIQLVLLSS